MIQKAQIQSVILTKDRDFKHRAVSFFNNIAFNAEKTVVESVSEAIGLIKNDPRYLNVIIDGRDFGFLLNDLEQINQLCKKSALRAAMYLEDKIPDDKVKDIKAQNFFVFQLPFEKSHFNEVFHERGPKDGKKGPGGKGGAAFGGLVASVVNKASTKPPVKPQAPPKNLTAFETTAHVREAIAMINIVDKNRGAIDQVLKIGQIFNGVVGAFGYFTNKSGYNEIKFLSIIIDDISRFYESNDKESISDDHYELLFNAIKSSFLLLQALRDNKAPSEDNIKKAQDLQKIYMDMDDLKKRDNFSQDAIDEMLESEKKDA